MKIVLQSRDIDILKFAFKFRVVSYDQIARKLFSQCHPTIAHRRTRQLVDAGFLDHGILRIDRRIRNYVQPNAKSWSVIRDCWPFEIESPHFKSESPTHDIGVAEIFMVFEKFTCLHLAVTENLLQSSEALSQEMGLFDLRRLQADGGLLLNGPDGCRYIYGIEVEASKKTPERYREKLASYYLAKGINGVIYVCSSQEISNSLAKLDQEVRQERESILYLVPETDVLESKGSIYFASSHERGIKLY